jgi:hypothetical protein
MVSIAAVLFKMGKANYTQKQLLLHAILYEYTVFEARGLHLFPAPVCDGFDLP